MCEAQNQPVTFSDLKPLPRECGVGIGPLPGLLGMVRSSRAVSLVSFNTYLITVNWMERGGDRKEDAAACSASELDRPGFESQL